MIRPNDVDPWIRIRILIRPNDMDPWIRIRRTRTNYWRNVGVTLVLMCEELLLHSTVTLCLRTSENTEIQLVDSVVKSFQQGSEVILENKEEQTVP